MSPDDRALHETVKAMPSSDRTIELLCAVINDEPTALRSTLSIFAVAMSLSRFLPPQSRFEMSELLRDCADKLERPQVGSVLS
jgi:hypothetical protein